MLTAADAVRWFKSCLCVHFSNDVRRAGPVSAIAHKDRNIKKLTTKYVKCVLLGYCTV